MMDAPYFGSAAQPALNLAAVTQAGAAREAGLQPAGGCHRFQPVGGREIGLPATTSSSWRQAPVGFRRTLASSASETPPAANSGML